MADPVRKDEPLSDVRLPESPSTKPTANRTPVPGPVPVRDPAEPAALLPDDLPDRSLGEWPVEPRPVEPAPATPSVENRAGEAGERVGSTIGTVLTQTREIGAMVQDRMSDLKKRFRVISRRGSSDLKERATEVSEEAQRRAHELAREAQREARHWEFRARVYARNYPFRFVGAAAAAGFAIGFLLRLWRDE